MVITFLCLLLASLASAMEHYDDHEVSPTLSDSSTQPAVSVITTNSSHDSEVHSEVLEKPDDVLAEYEGKASTAGWRNDSEVSASSAADSFLLEDMTTGMMGNTMDENTTVWSPDQLLEDILWSSSQNTSSSWSVNQTGGTEENIDNATLVQSPVLPRGAAIVNYVQTVFAGVGFLANTVTIVVLHRCSDDFGSTMAIIIKHQSVVDALVCLCRALMSVTPPLWSPGLLYLDIFICHVWHTQVIQMYFVSVSSFNLVVMAVDRFFAIVRPLDYSSFTTCKTRIGLALTHILSCINWPVAVLGASYSGGKCMLLPSNTLVLSVVAWAVIFAVPSSTLIALYSCVIHTLRQRQDASLAHSRIIEQATKLMTKSAIAVSVTFIITFGYIGNAILVSAVMVIPQDIFLIMRTISGFLTVLNSTINPVIYAFYLPVFRRGLHKVFCFCTYGRERKDDIPLSQGRRQPDVKLIAKYATEKVISIE